MIFISKVCEDNLSQIIWERGGGYNNLHLIADNLRCFREPRNNEEYLAAYGEEVKHGSVNTWKELYSSITDKISEFCIIIC